MEYEVGNIGRVVVARLSEGEDVYENIEEIARKEKIGSAVVTIVGGFRKAKVVVGPKREMPKIEADFRDFQGPGEVLGIGTIFQNNGQPSLHLHASIGKADQVMTGCPRGGAKTFLVLEVTIIEINDTHAIRKFDDYSGFKLLSFEK